VLEDPLAQPDIGSVTIKGQMLKYVTAADLEEAFESVPGIERTSITTVQREESDGRAYYTYEGTARLTALAFSARFSAAWIEQDTQSRASQVISDRLAAAEQFHEAEEEAYSAGLIDITTFQEAGKSLEQAQSDDSQVLALIELIIQAEVEVALQQEAVAYGDEGAEGALTAAEQNLDTLESIFNPLAQAILAWDEEADDLALVEARIEAAEDYLAFCEERVDLAGAAVTAGEAGADEALTWAETWSRRAKRGLEMEQSFLTAATEAEARTRTVLDEALAAVELFAPVEESTESDVPVNGEDGEES